MIKKRFISKEEIIDMHKEVHAEWQRDTDD